MSAKPKEPKNEVHSKVSVDSYHKEITKKEQTLIVNALRKHANLSDNGLLRAMTNAEKMFEAKQREDPPSMTTSNFIGLAPNLVGDDGGRKMLTRGSLPTSIPAQYSSFPNDADWSAAEARHNQLASELAAVESELEQRKKAVEQDRHLISVGGNLDDLQPKNGSHVLGSAFRWKAGGCGHSTAADSFVWHKPSVPVSARVVNPDAPEKSAYRGTYATSHQYGLMTKCCDLPEGNILVNKNAVKNPKLKATLKSP